MADRSGKFFSNPILLVVIAALVVAAALIVASQFSAQREQQALIGPEPEEPSQQEAQPTEQPSSSEEPEEPAESTMEPTQTEQQQTTAITEQPTKGDPDAPVTIIEFAEFYCPYCARYLWETFPKIEQEYIQEGLAKYEFRNLAVHGPPALLAAVAGECAHQQGKFWDLHDRLFETVFPGRNISNHEQLDIDDLERVAAQVGLDMESFEGCLEGYNENYNRCLTDYRTCVEEGGESEQCAEQFAEEANSCLAQNEMLQKAQEDQEELDHLISELPADEQKKAQQIGTPTFFINGHILIGAQPYENFKKAIERELEKAKQE
jgi:protein-disulfide isomerase